MNITLSEIIKNDLFKDIEILAGESGLFRKVKRISVFDCPYKEDILDDKIVDEGDFFISCLEQFKVNQSNMEKFIDSLISGKCSGLLVVNDDCIDTLDKDTLQKCNENGFPILLIRENLPYAHIMHAINKYIAIDNANAINSLKIDKIRYGNITGNEKVEILYSINPNIEQNLRVIYVNGEFESQIAQGEFYKEFLNRKSDIYIRSNNYSLFILSGQDGKSVKHNSDVVSSRISDLMKNSVLGYSRIHNRKDIAKALEEGRRALDTAKSLEITKQEYDPLMSLQLLLCVKDSEEAYDFYDAYVEMIRQKVSEENLTELLQTIELFVAHSGNYLECAKAMNQHENTIRYRVNKVKVALHMEADNIKFYETIAIAVKLRHVLSRKL
ncbi:PucR family transcriptional regulator [Sinanaerobacter sp. ZZT-01]|uniref:PucR family transcriptional regulator n=1 Tax=Sinanaerobacter sp. ZZT-01 TaxID=3111540 RepID=UPI002D76C445|nr:PucR family transcriptional regulator ligand-binding domain-containing protein [Sinanaerobacter sp. ZZT-01]WRR92059.1 PucR family transcriptional regulator ligand-binding domain-containing protein [Sinanaerobacter sp. ZZT-01]